MFVEASDQCNQLSFHLGTTGIGAKVAARSWSLQVIIVKTIGITNRRVAMIIFEYLKQIIEKILFFRGPK